MIRGRQLLAGALLSVLVAASMATPCWGEGRPLELLDEAVGQLAAGSHDDAEAKAGEALELCRQEADPACEAEALLALAAIEGRRRITPRVVELYRRSAELHRRAGNPLGRWQALYGLAEATRFMGRHDEALAAGSEALELLHRLEDPATPLDLGAFRLVAASQGLPLDRLGSFPEIEGLGLRRLVVGQLRVMTQLGRAAVLRLEGRFDEALATLDQLLEQAPVEGLLEPRVLVARAEVEQQRGNVERAVADLEAALASSRRFVDELRLTMGTMGLTPHLADFRLDEALVLRTLATVHLGQGRFEEALDGYREALAIARAADRPEVLAQLTTRIGTVFQLRGRYDRARAHFERGLELAREAGALDAEAATLEHLADVENLEGRHEEALRLQKEALAIVQAGGQRVREGNLLLAVGRSYLLLHQLEEAHEFLSRARELAREVGYLALKATASLELALILQHQGQPAEASTAVEEALEAARSLSDPAAEVEALQMSGWILHAEGRGEPAIGKFEQALEVARTSENPLGEVGALLGLGRARDVLRRDPRAEEGYREALAVARRIDSEPHEAVAFAGLGALHRRRGDVDAAIAALEAAAAILDRLHGKIQLDELAISFDEQLPSAVQSGLVDLHVRRGDRDAAFAEAERARARTFLRRLGNPWHAGAPADGDPRLRRAARERRELRRIESELERLRTEDPEGWRSPQTVRLRRELEAARDRHDETLRELRLERPEAASLLEVDAATLPELQHRILGPETTLVAYFVLDRKVVAWVVDRDRARMVELGVERSVLEREVERLENHLVGRDFDPVSAALLRRELIAPLEPHLRHRRLIVVPHGPLHRLPFAVLWDPRRERYLIEDYTLSYAPSATALRFLAGRGPGAGRPLVVGDPAGDLPAARAEGRAVAELYGVPAHLGPEATEARLWAEGRDAGVVHVAAHATFDPRRPRYSRLELAAGGGRDGRLEVHEIFAGLDLRGVDLLVLSACDTGRGERTRGDEVVGLTRALTYAGARAVVTTFWRIDDRSTSLLMTEFHRRLRAGADAAEALRRAQLATLARPEWSQPFFWAAFALHGDGGALSKPQTTLGEVTDDQATESDVE